MLETITSQFQIGGTFIKAERFGSGLINDTYLCEYKENEKTSKYILQRINSIVFKQPEHVMHNIEVVTSHILKQLSQKGIGNSEITTPTLLYSKKGQPYFRDSLGSYWRLFRFIEVGSVFDTIHDIGHAFEVGCCLGKFQSLTSDIKPQLLHVTLPGFHDTPRYLKEYDKALKENCRGRSGLIEHEVAFVEERRVLAPTLMELMSSGGIPLRVVHNDPKVNNIMIHTMTHKALCMLDLDTVMPGIVHFDYADCVRSAANPAGEEKDDLQKVDFDLSFFEAITKGYLQEAGKFLTREERDALPVSIKVLTFELGIRFLADYLRGDSYFKIKYPVQNLDRAQVQFRLLERVEAKYPQIASVVALLASA